MAMILKNTLKSDRLNEPTVTDARNDLRSAPVESVRPQIDMCSLGFVTFETC